MVDVEEDSRKLEIRKEDASKCCHVGFVFRKFPRARRTRFVTFGVRFGFSFGLRRVPWDDGRTAIDWNEKLVDRRTVSEKEKPVNGLSALEQKPGDGRTTRLG